MAYGKSDSQVVIKQVDTGGSVLARLIHLTFVPFPFAVRAFVPWLAVAEIPEVHVRAIGIVSASIACKAR